MSAKGDWAIEGPGWTANRRTLNFAFLGEMTPWTGSPAWGASSTEMRATNGSQSSVAGLDLYLDRPGGKVRDGVMEAIRDAIRSGRLVPGVQLPSSRVLAADLGVARNTVARAYAELIAEGWLTSHHGSGTLVAQRAEVVRSSPHPPSDGRSASWTTTYDQDIRTCRRFHGRSGVVRSSERSTPHRSRRLATPIQMGGRSFAAPLPNILLVFGGFGPDRATSSSAAAPPKD
ncbi:hypothetical protein MSTO_21230 [Mycobacterium stomatepiae]|uniref:HTH gntR-type domain-containing protein n=1 Tax=Mycobacterium stomatepiae TaxID=470076 RepID=A0A7I7Q6H0_9MYCO|nr:hypothetical protein MSTO_21230 [Mycobacterium stomatepiae]